MTGDSLKPARADRAMTPLWVISLFVSLSETVTTIAVTQATGNIKVALTSFVIVFPVLVGSAFFAILWARPYVLYPPTEFGGQTDVTKFVDAMRRRDETDAKTMTLLRSAVDGAFASPQIVARVEQTLKSGEQLSEKKLETILKDAGRQAWSSLEKNFITVDPTPIVGSGEGVRQVPYDPDQLVSYFLDDVWFSLLGKIPSYTYGDLWIVRDPTSGFELREAGRKWARKHGENEDLRTLREVGIQPGMRLETIRLKKERR